MPTTPRQRLLCSLNHEEPDRLPIFSPNIMDTHEPYDTDLRDFLAAFPFDNMIGVAGLAHPPSEPRPAAPTNQTAGDRRGQELVDGYGCRYVYRGVGLPYCTFHPLAHAETIADVEAFPWPDPESVALAAADDALRERAIAVREERLTAVGVPHLFHQYHYLRGFEAWMIDTKLNRGVHQAIAGHIHAINTTLVMRMLEIVGDVTDVVSAGDDFGTSIASYMSPADFRTLIKPFYSDLIGRIKARHPHIRFYLHSHGQIMDLVPDLIECGVDILNPILPLDNMDPARLKRDFGSDLCFHGGIDVERIVPFGTVAETRDHVKRVIDVLGPGGGYWLKLQVISPVCPPENVIAAYETAAAYGDYGKGSRC